MTSPFLVTRALLGSMVLTTSIAAAETASIPSISFSVEGIRVTQDYRPLAKIPGLAHLPVAQQRQMQRQMTDPWGIWRPGIHLRLAVLRPEGWALLSSDELHATARMDSGEVLAEDATAEADTGMMSDSSSGRNAETTLWPTNGSTSEAQSTIGLDLAAPTKACRAISSLQGRLRVVLGDLSDLKLIHIIPTTDPQTVPGMDLVIKLTAEGKISFGYTTGSLKACHDVQLLAADGSQLTSNNTSSEANNNHMSMTFGTAKPVAGVDLHFFQHYRAFLTEFTFSDLCVAGAIDPASLTRKSTSVQETPMPKIMPTDAGMQALPPATKKSADPF